MAQAGSTEKVVREIRRHTRRRFSAEEKIRIVLEGLRGEESIAALCRREGLDLPAFFGPVITGEQRRSGFSVCVRVLPGQREPASPASAHRHPSQY